MKKCTLCLAVGLSWLIGFYASASTDCRVNNLENALLELGITPEQSSLASVDNGKFEISLGIDRSSGAELVYEVSVPQTCESRINISQAVYEYDQSAAAIIPVANRFGNRCAPGFKYWKGSCCQAMSNGTYKCPKRKCHPWEGPGCRKGQSK